jgi:hypothetical protein
MHQLAAHVIFPCISQLMILEISMRNVIWEGGHFKSVNVALLRVAEGEPQEDDEAIAGADGDSAQMSVSGEEVDMQCGAALSCLR